MSKQPAAMLHISGANKEAVREARAAIADILKQPHVDNSTKVEAIKALLGLCGVSNTTITGCSFTSGSKP